MPRTKKEPDHIPHLIDANIHNLAARLRATRDAIANLKLKEKELVTELEPFITDIEGGKMVVDTSEGFAPNQYPKYTLTLSPGSNSTIKREKLLERGVGPDVIDYATSRTGYTQIRVQETKENNDA